MLGARRRIAQGVLTGVNNSSRIGHRRMVWASASVTGPWGAAGGVLGGMGAGIRTAFTGDPETEPWTVLGVDRAASEDEVQRAWRKKAAATHPDRGGDPAEFLALQRAYEKMKRTIFADAQNADRRFDGGIDFKTFYFLDVLQEAKARKHMSHTRVLSQMRQAVDAIRAIVQDTHFHTEPLKELAPVEESGSDEKVGVIRIEEDAVADQYNLAKILLELMPAAVAKARAENDEWLGTKAPQEITNLKIAVPADRVFIYPEVVCKAEGKAKKRTKQQQQAWGSWFSSLISSFATPNSATLTPQAGVDILASQLAEAERASFVAFGKSLAQPPAPKQLPKKDGEEGEESPESAASDAQVEKPAKDEPAPAESGKGAVPIKPKAEAPKPGDDKQAAEDASTEKPSTEENQEEPRDPEQEKKDKKKKEEDKAWYKHAADEWRESYFRAALSVHSQSEYAKLVTKFTKTLPFIFPDIRPSDPDQPVIEKQKMLLFNYLLRPEVSRELIHLYKSYYSKIRTGDADEPLCEIGFKLSQLADWPVDKLDSKSYWGVNTEAKIPVGEFDSEVRLKWREDWILTPEALSDVNVLKRNIDACMKASKHYRMVLRVVEEELPYVSLHFPPNDSTYTPARWRRFVNELRKTKRMKKALELHGLQVRMSPEGYGCSPTGGLLMPWSFSEGSEYAHITLPVGKEAIDAPVQQQQTAASA